MSFLYALLLKLLYPTSLATLLLVTSAFLRKFNMARRICFWLAIALLVVCGNGWVARGMTRHLEDKFLSQQPVPDADCILILSGGIAPQIPPRTTVEVDDAGDRVLFGAHLFRLGKAHQIICTGNVATGGIAPHPAAEDMAELLETLGVPKDDIALETKAENTHQHAIYVDPLLRKRGFKRVLLVTSAMHMPRAMLVMRKHRPDIDFIPAPTDFRAPDIPLPWYRELVAVIPSPANFVLFTEAAHEYLGLLYYRLRGWI